MTAAGPTTSSAAASASAAPPRGGTASVALLLCVALCLVLGLVLRFRDPTAFRLSPDDGNLLHSARAHELERGDAFEPGRWLTEDAQWVRWLARDFGTDSGRTFQHSYLRQVLVRWLVRLGWSPVRALRFDPALLGGLTALALLVLAGRGLPVTRATGAAAACALALSTVHVWYSRTGWGQVGCTFFLLLHLALVWRLVGPRQRPRGSALAWIGAGLAATSLLAFGFHEMASVYVVATGVVVALAPWLWPEADARGSRVAELVRSPRTWTWVAGAAPVGLLTLGLLTSEYASDRWFDPDREIGWLEARRLSLDFLWRATDLPEQIGWVVLALVPVGLVAARAREGRAFRFLLASLVLGPAILFLGFNNPSLVRIYLPAVVVATLLAAEGALWLVARLPAGAPRLAGAALGVLALGWLGARTAVSLFGPLGHPLMVTELYWPNGVPELREARHGERAIVERLERELEPGEWVGTTGGKEILFVLLERGLPARFAPLGAGRELWPRFLVGDPRFLRRDGLTTATGGPWEPVAEHSAGNFVLYRLQGR